MFNKHITALYAVELLVVLTRVAVTQLAAAGQQLALAAILTFGQKCIDLKNRKRICYLYPHLLFINI
jgi:hypothetical protein